jgi:hypothetical protein
MLAPDPYDLDARERAALLRVRVLRRDGYRCRWATGRRARPCGAPASLVGSRPADDEIVALCLSHGLPR